jgi:hypothetical protein
MVVVQAVSHRQTVHFQIEPMVVVQAVSHRQAVHFQIEPMVVVQAVSHRRVIAFQAQPTAVRGRFHYLLESERRWQLFGNFQWKTRTTTMMQPLP